MIPAAVSPLSFTPRDLTFDEARHQYTIGGIEVLAVTEVLRDPGLVDLLWATDEARALGQQVHAAIELTNERPRGLFLPDAVRPYVSAYRRFLIEGAFRVDAAEEMLGDRDLGVAGRLDLRGVFAGGGEAIDVIDIKTGSVPPWVGYQTAGYVRLLPVPVRRRCRRWCLNLRGDGTYRLKALLERTDESVFLAAVTIARAKRGLL
jgi:hypothetical protein